MSYLAKSVSRLEAKVEFSSTSRGIYLYIGGWGKVDRNRGVTGALYRVNPKNRTARMQVVRDGEFRERCGLFLTLNFFMPPRQASAAAKLRSLARSSGFLVRSAPATGFAAGVE